MEKYYFKNAEGVTVYVEVTEEQKKALIELVDALKKNIPTINSVKGHRDYSKDLNKNGRIDPSEYIKACPCFEVSNEF